MLYLQINNVIKINMKKIILIIIIFIAVSNFCFAEEDNKTLLPSRIGATVGMLFVDIFSRDDYSVCEPPIPPDGEYEYIKAEPPRGIGITIFYNHSLVKKCFVSLKTEYNYYKNKTDNIVATIGVNWYVRSDNIYLGMAGGILTEKDTWGRRTKSEFNLVCGFSIPIQKYNISIEANGKIGINQSGINIGVAYLIP